MIPRRPGRTASARNVALALALALAPAALSVPARAEPTREDRAAATALFDEGRKLLAAKKYAEACPKLEAAMRLDPGMGTLYNLSDCYEQIGRTASAWSGFRDVAAQAKAQNRPDHEQAARDRAAALEPKLAKLRIVVPPELAGVTLEITRDGSPVPLALAGTAIPLDPGPHTIRVTAEGKEPFEKEVTLRPEGGTVDVQIPALAPKKAGGPSGPATSPTTTATAPPPPPTAEPPDTSPRPWQKPLGITATVVGALGAGAGVALGFVAKGTFDESNKANCDVATNVCNPEGLTQRSDAVNLGNIATGVLVAGAVIGAAGIVLWITAPSAPAAPKAGLVLPGAKAAVQGALNTTPVLTDVQVGATPGGLVVRGRF